MDCQECNELLPLYIDQSLTKEEIQTICTHIDSCSHCKEEMELLTKTLGMVKNLECVDAPADFHDRFQKRFQKECRPGFRWGFWGIFSFGSVAAAAAVLLVVVLNNPIGEKNPNVPLSSMAQQASAELEPDKKTIETEMQPLIGNDNDVVAQTASSQTSQVKAEINPYTNNPSMQNQASELRQARAMNAGFSSEGQKASRKPGYRMQTTSKNTQPELLRQRSEWSGNHCAIHQAKNQVVRTQDELAALWQSAGIQSIVIPPIDWSKKMVGMICLGDNQGRGYEIMLKEVAQKNKTMIVKYQINNQNITQDGNVTQPFMIFTMPKTGRQVIFEQES